MLSERIDARQKVSIRAPARGATTTFEFIRTYGQFRSAPPHGGRHFHPGPVAPRRQFRSAPPHGGRPQTRPRTMPDVGFDPRPRTGGDGRRGASPRRFGVSIRAPARGATVHDELHVVAWHVSIRAPARGATCYAEALDTRFGVSIRAPARGATTTFVINSDMNCVSIRAPARGATSAGADLRQFALFRSAPPHGGRLSCSSLST